MPIQMLNRILMNEWKTNNNGLATATAMKFTRKKVSKKKTNKLITDGRTRTVVIIFYEGNILGFFSPLAC